MITNIKLVVLFVLFLFGCEPDYSEHAFGDEAVIPLADLTQDKLGRGYHNGRPYTGTAVTLNNQESLVLRFQFSYGEIHGLVEEWHDNRSRKSLVEYTNHFKDGLALSWGGNQFLNSVIHYDKDLREGLSINFDDNGQVDQYFCYKDDEQVSQNYCISEYMTQFVDYLDYVLDVNSPLMPEFDNLDES